MDKKSEFRKLSLLYVEDDEDIRNELAEILELEFGNLYVAKDGEEGLKLFQSHSPDIVVSDIQMPKLDGLQMCEEIRKLDPDVPIIITTAFNDPSFLIKAIDIGVDKYVVKPIQLKQLEDTLVRCSKLVFQKKTIHDLMNLSKHLMDRHDNFMFVSGDDFSYVNKPLLNFLGFNTIEEFEKDNTCIFKKLQDVTYEEVSQTKQEWLKFLQNNVGKEHVIYLKECNIDRDEIIPYKVNMQYFQEIEHFLITFDGIKK